MGWTDERVELLKRLWTEGLSASQIADKLGGVSRNAVIGKVHRLKLESRAKSPNVAAPVAERQASPHLKEVETIEMVQPARFMPAQSVSARSMPRTHGATALKMDPEEETEVIAEPQRQSGEVVPIARKLSLVQLTESTCKWPVGDPLKPGFHFCGNGSNESSPYCEYHASLAFQPASERRRAR
ncbi:GcrA family cell cycle regulator [Aurantimonas sp. E1-2-R+4]|uniref:GcrA family cell cycle regulator n=1 Tax=Aurantimonas sp. E1-2-R+4 TaxID=3113714 RepID=UPI002F9238DB